MNLLTVALTAVGAVMLSTVGVPPAPATPEAGPPPVLGEIAIVPLDDRPFTYHHPAEIARAGGFAPLVPEADLLGEFLEAGDADAVGQWWQEAAAEADASVVAVPMLTYGGLVASRECSTDLDTALDRLGALEEVAAADADQPIFAFDVIQRLATIPTAGYPGSYAGDVRRWATLMDQVENLGMEDLRDEYEAITEAIPQEIRDDYLCARERNHQVNRAMIQLAADGVVDFLILGQDDASEFGPHRVEKIALQQLVDELGVGDRVEIYPGADVLGAMLVAKHIVRDLGVSPTVAVEWSRTHGDDWTGHYQDIPYGTLVREYIETLGATATDDADASDVLLMANTGGAGSLEPFADRIHEALARGRTVAIGDDARAGTVDAELRDLLAPRIRFGELAGWSGWNVGLSLTQAVVRSALVEASREAPLMGVGGLSRAEPILDARQALLENAAAANVRLLFHELTHTDLYRNEVRSDVRDYAVEAGDDPQRMTFSLEAANQLAVDGTLPLAETMFDAEFRGAPLALGNDGAEEHTGWIEELHSLEVGLGWPRYQELDVDADIAIRTGVPSPAALVALLPRTFEILPERATTVELTAVVRNVTVDPLETALAVQVPEGWTATIDDVVPVPGLDAVEVALAVSAPPTAVGDATEVVLEATAAGATDSASSTIVPVWTNVALASEGASATASGWWSAYEPVRAIDGNTVSTSSRWLTEVGPAHWLDVRFAEPSSIDTVTLHQYGGYLLEDYTVSALVDGEWVQVHETVGNTETVHAITFDGVVASGVRLDVTATRDGRVRLYELEATCRVWDGCTL